MSARKDGKPKKCGPAKGTGCKTIDMSVLRTAAEIGCTIEEIAAFLSIGVSTFYEHLERDQSLREVIDEARNAGRETLRRIGAAAALKCAGQRYRMRHGRSASAVAPAYSVSIT
jgi:hypothetical protein